MINTLIKNKFAIDIYIDEDYKIISNKENFLWIGRGFPYRWIMIHKTFIKDITDYWSIYSELLYNNTDGIYISNYYKFLTKMLSFIDIYDQYSP